MHTRTVASWVACVAVGLSLAGCGQLDEILTILQSTQNPQGPTGVAPPHFPPGSYCDPGPFGQWCFYNPRPSGDWWRALGGKGHEIWVSGSSTGALHFDGHGWSRIDTGLTDAEGFAVFSPHNVWIVGQIADGTGTIAHFDGNTFTTSFQHNGEFQDIWGAGPNDIYAVSFGGAVHWNGAVWTPVPGVNGQSVSGTNGHDVWVADFNGLQHFDGTSWQAVPAFQGAFVISVVAIAHHDVWAAVLHNGMTDLEHWDGQTWTVSTTLTGNRNIKGLGAGGPNDVWAVGSNFVPPALTDVGLLEHFDGQTWTELADAPALVSRMAHIGHDDFAVGQAGEILHLDAGLAVPFTNLTQGPTVTLAGTWGSSPTDMWAVGAAGTILQYDGHVVRWLQIPQGPALNAVWGTSHNDVWAVGAAGTVLHFNGAVVQRVVVHTMDDLFAVFTAAPGDVWIGGADSTLLHVIGGTATQTPIPNLPTGSQILVLHGIAADDLWAGGESSMGGFVSHWDGSSWSAADFVTQNTGSHPVGRLWEVADDDVWVITSLGFAGAWEYLHFNGAVWTETVMPPSADTWMFNGAEPNVANSSFAFNPDDVWSAGPLGAWRRRTPIP
jgi:hypothetical protein